MGRAGRGLRPAVEVPSPFLLRGDLKIASQENRCKQERAGHHSETHQEDAAISVSCLGYYDEGLLKSVWGVVVGGRGAAGLSTRGSSPRLSLITAASGPGEYNSLRLEPRTSLCACRAGARVIRDQNPNAQPSALDTSLALPF